MCLIKCTYYDLFREGPVTPPAREQIPVVQNPCVVYLSLELNYRMNRCFTPIILQERLHNMDSSDSPPSRLSCGYGNCWHYHGASVECGTLAVQAV